MEELEEHFEEDKKSEPDLAKLSSRLRLECKLTLKRYLRLKASISRTKRKVLDVQRFLMIHSPHRRPTPAGQNSHTPMLSSR